MKHEEIKERMRKDLKILQMVRDKEEVLRNNYNKIRDMFQEANKPIIDNLKSTQEKLSTVEEKLRSNAVEYYGHTGDKQLVGGIGIRIMTKLDYDIDKALKWAKQHGLAIQLDKKNFEKIAKTQDIMLEDENIVVKREVPSATLPSKIKLEEKNETKKYN